MRVVSCWDYVNAPEPLRWAGLGLKYNLFILVVSFDLKVFKFPVYVKNPLSDNI